MSEQEVITKSKAPTTAQDLMEVMGENIQRLRDGEATPAVANAIVNSSAAMLRIVKLQLEYAKATNSQPPEIPLLGSGKKRQGAAGLHAGELIHGNRPKASFEGIE